MSLQKMIEVKDPFTYLCADHRKVEAVFKKISSTTENAVAAREEAFSELYALLMEHTEIEEAILYPVLLEHDETRDISQEAEVEHSQAKKLLADLVEMNVASEEWTATVTVLEEEISHHVKEEEAEMFPKARKALGSEKVEELRLEMERFLAEPTAE